MKRSQKFAIIIAITALLFVPTVVATQTVPLLITTVLSNPTPPAGSFLRLNITVQSIRPEEIWIYNITVFTDWMQDGYEDNITSPIQLHINEQYNTSIPLTIPFNVLPGNHSYKIKVHGNESNGTNIVSIFDVYTADEIFQVVPTPTPTSAPTANPTTNPTSNPTYTATPTYTPTPSPTPPTVSPTQSATPTATPTSAPEITIIPLISTLVLTVFGVIAIKLRNRVKEKAV